MIAIHNSNAGFHPHWIEYCQQNNIPNKIVDCYANDIIEQLKSCDALMWHFHHQNPKDILFAKQLMFSLQQAGKKAFPDFNTMWHFDDKVGQKYLLESIGAPLVPTYVNFDKKEALKWAEKTTFPKVFKLRGGAGSANVKLVKNKNEAVKLINKAFGIGFKNYDALLNLKERWRKYRLNKTNFWNVIKGVIRLGFEPEFSKTMGNERGYVYFQDFISGNTYDTRVIVIDGKAYGMQRYIRKNDFRASGSEKYSYDDLDKELIKIAFDISGKLKLQVVAFDFIRDNDKYLIIEMSFGYGTKGSSKCLGYWDNNLNWYPGNFNPYGWMVDLVRQQI